MIMQGADDSRVPQSEAEQMVKAVRANGKDVWYVLGTNEGHGFAKKDNADYYFLLTLMFWQKNFCSQQQARPWPTRRSPGTARSPRHSLPARQPQSEIRIA